MTTRKKAPRHILAKRIYHRVNRRNQNALICFVGPTGTGKSYSAIRLCQMVDPTFTTDRIKFTSKEFLGLLRDGNLKKGSAIIFDEFGVAHSARSWYDITNKMINFILQTFRRQNLVVCFTVPDASFVDIQARKLFHYIIDLQRINYTENKAYAKVFNVKPQLRAKEPYMIYPKKTETNGKSQKVTSIGFTKPDKETIKAYEKIKKEFSDSLMDNVVESIDREEKRNRIKEDRKNREPNAECLRCGHKWYTESKAVNPHCSSCSSRKTHVFTSATTQ